MEPGGTATRNSGRGGGGRFRTASQALQWVLPKPEVEAWLDRARPGERLIYAHGPQLIRGETSLYIRDLAMAGTVDPFHPRSPAGGFDFTIQKRRVVERSAVPPAAAAAPDEATDTIYRALVRAAAFGRRAHSNSELATLAGLATPPQAAWRIAKLAKAKRIRTFTITTGAHAGWRIVEIVETGKQTAAPPSWERAKAEARRESVK